ncbi:MAG: sensor histidine kinase [Candidatus Omnitrophota bacterium]
MAEAESREHSKHILAIQEEERSRISRDLHDETGQLSVSLGSALNILEKEIEKGNYKKALTIIRDAKSILSESSRRIKTLVLDLRPAELDILGIAAVLRELFSHYTKTYPLDIKFRENLNNVSIKEELAINLYRIIQEALNNIVKHARAKHVKMDLLIENNKINLFIEDDGVGFDQKEIMKNMSPDQVGLRGMRERVDLLSGKFLIDSKPRKGTSITASFSLKDA